MVLLLQNKQPQSLTTRSGLEDGQGPGISWDPTQMLLTLDIFPVLTIYKGGRWWTCLYIYFIYEDTVKVAVNTGLDYAYEYSVQWWVCLQIEYQGKSCSQSYPFLLNVFTHWTKLSQCSAPGVGSQLEWFSDQARPQQQTSSPDSDGLGKMM